ncbi:MAG: tetratricopeptide repeat protein [Cyanobacteria bacterium J06639_18]
MFNKLYFRVYRRLLLFIFGLVLGLLSTLFITTSPVFPVVAREKSPLSIIDKSSTHKSSVENLPIEKSSIQGLSELKQQEQRGKEYYNTGQFSAAVKIWQQVLLIYQSQGDRLNQARVLNNLSLAYQQLGKYSEAKQTISESLKLTQAQQNPTQNLQKEESTKKLNVIAQALNTRGRLELSMGKPEAALKTWEEAKEFYTKAENNAGVIRSAINQSQALRSNGSYHRALSNLTEVNEILQKQPDSQLKATGLRSLGTSLNLVGKFTDAQKALEESLAIAKKLSSPTDISARLIDLGNVANSQQQAKSALNFYQQAVDKANSPNIKIKAQLNIIKTLIDTQKLAKAQLLANQIQSQITNLPVVI